MSSTCLYPPPMHSIQAVIFIVNTTTYKHGAHHEQLLIGVVLVNKMDLQGEPETVHGVLYCMYKRRMSE